MIDTFWHPYQHLALALIIECFLLKFVKMIYLNNFQYIVCLLVVFSKIVLQYLVYSCLSGVHIVSFGPGK